MYLRRVGLELLLALVGAEVIRVAVVRGRLPGCGRLLLVHVHAADDVLRGARDPGRGRNHPAFRVDQERAFDDDALPHHEALEDLHPVADAPPGLHAARLEVAVAAVHEHHLAQARVDDRVGRHRDGRRKRGVEVHVHEHAGLERVVGVVEFEADLEGPRRFVEQRLRRADLRVVGARPLGHDDARRGARLDVVGLPPEDVGLHPDAGEVGNPVELRALLEPLPGRDVAGEDEARRGREDPDLL